MRKPLTLALSLLGMFDALYLLYTYTSPSRPMVCIGTGCDAVRASAYSTLWGVSMPVFGVLGYALLAIIIIAESLFSARLARLARYAFLGMTGFGFVFSLYLEYLQGFVIHAFCAWCVTSFVVMTALFALAILEMVRGAPEPEPAAQLMRVRNLFAVCVFGLLIGVPSFYLLARHGELPPAPPQASPASLAERLVRPGSYAAGNPQAPLTVVEFGDFECPVCGRGEAAAREIRTRYAGQIHFVFRQFPLERIHPFAEKASEASECAGAQGKFWEMVDQIYSRQDDLSIAGLEHDAAAVGLDQPRFNQCLSSGATAGRVRRDLEDGRALGVRATPTFFIGQQKVEGVLTATLFSQLVDAHLATLAVPVPPAPPARKAVAKKTRPVSAPPPQTQTAAVQPLTSIPGAAPVGFAAGLPGTPANGLFGGLQKTGGEMCTEADAAKKQPALIDTQELRQLLANHSRPLFVDVRPASDYAAGRIPGAVNLPADDVAQRWDTLPKDRTIILYEGGRASGDVCAAGRAVGRALLEHGFPFSQVKVYQGGLAGWQHAGISLNQQVQKP